MPPTRAQQISEPASTPPESPRMIATSPRSGGPRIGFIGARSWGAGALDHAVLRERDMTPTGLAVFVLISFLIPVPILAWLDRPRRPKD